MGKKEINIDYIGVVTENNGVYTFEQVPIIKSLEIKEQLRAMCENPNRTLQDMHPEEMSIAFKAEKITSALSFINKLQMAGDIYRPALAAIDAIKDLNITVVPDIEERMETIHSKIKKLNTQMEGLYKDLAPYNKAQQVHEYALNHLYEQDKTILRERVEDEYRIKHPDYVALCKTRTTLQGRIDSLKRDIDHRYRFLNSLQKCYSRIADAGKLAA